MKLYRYQPINKYSLINLSLGKNWASNPKDFNDPFEFVMRSDYILKDDKVVPIPHEHYRIKREIKKEISTLGVVCYSELEESILLWSHYADGHKGMALVFEIENPLHESIVEVKYEQLLPEMNFDEDPRNLNKGLVSAVVTKAKNWEYEKEWREIVNVQNMNIHYPGKLVEIIFGCKASTEDMEMIWRIAEPMYGEEILFSRLDIQDDMYAFAKRFPDPKQNRKLNESKFFSTEELNPWKDLD